MDEGRPWQDRKQDFVAAYPPKKKRRWRWSPYLLRLFTWPYNLFTYSFLAGMIYLGYQGYLYRAELERYFLDAEARVKTAVRLNSLKKGLRADRLATNRYPPSLESFLSDSPRTTGEIEPYQDFWGTDLRYWVSGTRCEIRSAGADRVFGTADDMVRQIEVPH